MKTLRPSLVEVTSFSFSIIFLVRYVYKTITDYYILSWTLYLPSACMDSVILPVVKNKGGDLTDIDNYRAIAVSNAETKILETVILTRFNEVDNYL